MTTASPRPVPGLYIHVPFCASKCPYCDFYSVASDSAHMEAYVSQTCRLLRRIPQEFPRFQPDTLYLGGGTPSLLGEERLLRILDTAASVLHLPKNAEITLEANPGTLAKEKLEIYRKAGVNRLSIGLQSAEDKELSLLGRIHTFEEFKESYRLAGEAGFRNISVDLMAALPGQSVKSFERSLRAVTGLFPAPEHISVYNLIVEEGTPFYEKYHRQVLAREAGEEDCRPLPTEEEERDMYALTGNLLAACGYERYEISNYAKPGFACRHNVGYWTGAPYLGFGISASSYLSGSYARNGSRADERFTDGRRFSNTDDLGTYLRILEEWESGRETALGRKLLGRLRQGEETVTRERAMEEFMFLGLRMTKGVSGDEFAGRFGTDLEDVYGTALGALERDGLMERTMPGEGMDVRWRLTARGIDVSNCVLAEFLF